MRAGIAIRGQSRPLIINPSICLRYAVDTVESGVLCPEPTEVAVGPFQEYPQAIDISPPSYACLASVNYPHVQGMTENECYPLLCKEIGDPVPAGDAFNPDQDVGWIRLDRLEKRFRAGLHVAMEYDLTVCVDYAEVHHPGVQVDTAVIMVRRTVESLRASFFRNTGYTGSISTGCAKADAQLVSTARTSSGGSWTCNGISTLVWPKARQGNKAGDTGATQDSGRGWQQALSTESSP